MTFHSRYHEIMRRGRFADRLSTYLYQHFVLLLLAMFGGAFVVILWQYSAIQASQLEASALRDAARYLDVVREVRTLYTSEVVDPAREFGLTISHDYKGQAGAISLPATLSMELGNRIASQGGGGETRLYSDHPFPWRRESGGLVDDFAKEAWESLNWNPDEPFWRIEEIDGRRSMRYATADLMRESCVNCHNNHEETPKNDWRVGDVRGVLEVITPLDQALAETSAGQRLFATIIVGLCILGIVTVLLVVARLRHTSSQLQETNSELTSENTERLKSEAQMKFGHETLQRRADELDRSRIAAINMMRDAERSEMQQRKDAKSLRDANQELGIEMTERKRAESDRAEMQQQMIEASRMAGVAEVATGVLHNVGNVLNSVNVSANLMMQSMRKSRIETVVKASDVITQHEDDLGTFLTESKQGRSFPRMLHEVSRSLISERDGQLDELAGLIEHVNHINEIISVQQSYARLGGTVETIDAIELMTDALYINQERLSRCGVEVVREFGDVPMIVSDRHKVMQILVNLINNSSQALDEAVAGERVLTLVVCVVGKFVKLQVRDSGAGISPENLTKIFNHGFTTKQDGHGFGLHSCALAAQELRGSLSVHSDGQGQDAMFTLEIPIQRED